MNPLQDLMNWISEILNEATMSIWKAFFDHAGIALDIAAFDHPITGLHSEVKTMVIISYVLLLTIGGILVMTHESIQTQYSLREILPRLVIGMIVVHLSFELIAQSLKFNDDLVAALLTVRNKLRHSAWISWPTDLSDAISMILTQHIRGDHGATLPSITMLLLMLLASIVLLVSSILRNIISVGLMIIAPACLAGHALPQTESIARWWWRMWAACHMSSAGQAAVLYLWSWLTFRPDGVETPISGTVYAEGLDLNILYLLITIWAMWKVHAMSFAWARGRPVRFPGSRLAMAVGGMMAWRGINSLGRKKKPTTPDAAPAATTTGRRSSQIAPSYTNVGGSRKLQVPAGPMASRTRSPKKTGNPATMPPNWSAKPQKPKKRKLGQKTKSGQVIPFRFPSPTVVPANAPKGRPPVPPRIPPRAPNPAAVPPRTATRAPKPPGVVPPVLPPRSSPPPTNPRRKKGGTP